MLDDRVVLLGLLEHREIAADIHEPGVVPLGVTDRPASVLGALPQDLLPNPVFQRLSHERSMLRGHRLVEDFDAVSTVAVAPSQRSRLRKTRIAMGSTTARAPMIRTKENSSINMPPSSAHDAQDAENGEGPSPW